MDDFVSGAIAGIMVDVSLFPLDTIKTRLQSPHGFVKSGGFRGIYQGLGPVAIGSGPGAAFFFVTYEKAKKAIAERAPDTNKSVVHMLAASVGEFIACLVRVPTEVIKQRMQTAVASSAGLSRVISEVRASPKGMGGFYAGFTATLMREIPFSVIQFPIYEASKKHFETEGESSFGAAICGACSGAFAAFVTTPMDVVKTRLMLGADINGVPYNGMLSTIQRVCAEPAGRKGLLAGATPRTIWIGIGGGVFFGAYTKAKMTFFPT
jgi:solute carrier family 25 S-adenosylmethionine transporter 26